MTDHPARVTAESANVMVVDQITTRFGDVVAVDGASLVVGGGEVVGLLGANGAGKTSLIRTLLGLVRPAAGRVEVCGGPPSRRTRALVGYVPQGLGLWPDLTVRDHFELVAAVYGRGRAVADTPAADVADERAGALPLGWRRRVAFALALSHDPTAVVLDEPTSGVDPLARARLWSTVRDTADAGAGILVSTHYLDEAAQCDRVVLLASGRVVAAGSAGELTAGERSVAVRPDRWDEAWRALEVAGLAALPQGTGLRVAGGDRDQVASVLAEADVAADVTEVPATLEEVFLRVSRPA